MKDDDRSHVAAQLASKTWAEIEVIEAQIGDTGRLLFPDVLHRRGADGKWVPVPVRFMVLRPGEQRAARVQAREIATEEGIDSEKDADQFENLDTVCLLWRAVREPTAPYEPVAMDPRDLERRFDKATLEQAWALYSHWAEQVDPRPEDIDQGEMMAVIAAVAERRDVRPLLALGGRSQTTCIVTMASLLAPYLRSSSSPGQSEPSTPAT